MTEFHLIDEIRARLGRRGNRVLIGSGDDAAVTRCDGVTVTTVDAFVEGVHFRLATTSMHDLGHKCVAAATSDIAAMGALPGEVYIALGLPEHLDSEEVLDLAEGAEALASELGFTICGGDISRSHELFIAVTATGHAGNERELVTRAGAKPGDRLGVTGALGGAAAGLVVLERKLGGLDRQTGEALLARQLRPWPLIESGRALAAAGVDAMIDVSDGIATDAGHLAERSGASLDIQLAELPLAPGVEAVARAAGRDPLELAASGGDDYELLFTASPDRRDTVESMARSAGTSVTWVGSVSSGTGARLIGADGRPVELSGYEHP